MSKAQRWEELPRLISDDVLHRFVTIGTYDEIGRKLVERYGSVVSHCEFSIAVRDDADRETLARLVSEVRASGSTPTDPSR